MKCVSCGKESSAILCPDCAGERTIDFYIDSSLLGSDLLESIGQVSVVVPIAYPAAVETALADMSGVGEIESVLSEDDLHLFMKRAGRLLRLFGVPLSFSGPVPFSGEDVRRISALVRNIEDKVAEGRVSGPADTLIRAGVVLLMASRTELYKAVGKDLDYPSRALALFEAALVVDPSSIHALEGKMNALLDSERYLDAYTAVQDTELPPRISVLAGLALAALGRYREAISHIDAALKEDIDNPWFWQAKCRVLSRMEMYPQAKACCERALELKEDDSESWLLLGDILTAMGDIEGGVEAYERGRGAVPAPSPELSRLTAPAEEEESEEIEEEEIAEAVPPAQPEADFPVKEERHLPERTTGSVIDSLLQDLEPLNPAPLLDEADSLLDEGRYDDAMKIYEQQIDMNPGNVRALIGKARALLGLRHLDAAFRTLDSVAEIEPENPWPWYYKGLAMRDLGRWGGAVQLLSTATSIRPDFIPAHIERARILTERGMLDDALRIYNTVLKIENSREAHTGKGTVLMMMGKWGAALQEALTSLKMHPADREALLLKARIEKDRGLWDRLLETAGQIVENYPEMVEGYLYRGEAYRGMDRLEEAAEAFGEAVKVDGTSPKAWLLLGETLSAMKEVDKALKIYDRALMLTREKELVWLARARALYDSGREKEGAEALRKAMQINPDSPEVKDFVMRLGKGGEE